MPTKAEVEYQLREATAQLTTLNIKFEGFKERVRSVAQEVADEQGWCYSGLNERLEELDLEKVAVSHRRKVLIEVEYEWEDDIEPDIGRLEIIQSGWNTRINITDWDITKREDVVDIYE